MISGIRQSQGYVKVFLVNTFPEQGTLKTIRIYISISIQDKKIRSRLFMYKGYKVAIYCVFYLMTNV